MTWWLVIPRVSARGNVDDGPVCELSSHHRHNVFTRSHHQPGSEQFQGTTQPHTKSVLGYFGEMWRKSRCLTFLLSFFPQSLRSRLLSWIPMKGNCHFCNKVYRWCSELIGKLYFVEKFSPCLEICRERERTKCWELTPPGLLKINWLLDSGNRFTSRPSLTTSETLINGQWSDNKILHSILISNKCAIFDDERSDYRSVLSSISLWLRPSLCSKSPISMQISELILPWPPGPAYRSQLKFLVPDSKWKWVLLETIRWHSNCGPFLNFGFQSEFQEEGEFDSENKYWWFLLLTVMQFNG